MKRLLCVLAMAAATAPAFAADVGVSISIGEPGFYGRLDIGDYPQPQVIYRRPLMVEMVPVDRPPIYLRVPPGHAKHWSKHCREYNACGERVFFVRDTWYRGEYVPRYQERHGKRQDEHRGNQANERKQEGRGDQKGNRGNDDRGRGRDR